MDKNDENKLLNELKSIISGKVNEIIRALGDIHKNRPLRVPNQIGNKSLVCFVLSCPGKEEMINGKPCQGITGKNLNKLINYLNGYYPKLFPYVEKEKYDILNSTQIVHFDELDGISEGSTEEIESEKKHIKMYIQKNEKLKFAILLGEKAKSIKDLFDNKYILSRHLGFQSINHIDTDCNGNNINDYYNTSVERTNARILVIAKEIINEIDELINNNIIDLEE